jgi:hypothetical protein
MAAGLARDQRLTVSWTSTGGSGSKTLTSRASGYRAKSGLIFKAGEMDPARHEAYGLGPKIPAGHVRSPSIDVTATLWDTDDPSLAVTTKTVRLEVVEPRKIHIKLYDFETASFVPGEDGTGGPGAPAPKTGGTESKTTYTWKKIVPVHARRLPLRRNKPQIRGKSDL